MLEQIESYTRDQHFRGYLFFPLPGKTPDISYMKVHQKLEKTFTTFLADF
jgi:hypothetical protein